MPSPDALIALHPHWESPKGRQVAKVSVGMITELLERDLSPNVDQDSMGADHQKDAWIGEMITFLERKELPTDDTRARAIAAQSLQFNTVNRVLYFVNNRRVGRACVMIPHHLRQQLLHENHSGPSGRHFSGQHTYNRLASR